MRFAASLLGLSFFFASLGSLLAAEPAVEELVRRCDDAIALRLNGQYKVAISSAIDIRDAGIERRDRALEARGLARLALVELHFGSWKPGWEEALTRALKLTEATASPSLARAECLMIDGYLKAMYLTKISQGVEQLKESIAIGRTLSHNRLFAQAFHYLACVSGFAGQPDQMQELWYRSIAFAEMANSDALEVCARNHLFRYQQGYFANVDLENQARYEELCQQFDLETRNVGKSMQEQMLIHIEEVEAVRDQLEEQKNFNGIKNANGILRACRLLTGHFADQEAWDKSALYLRFAKMAAEHLQDQSSQRSLLAHEAALLAKDGRGSEALDHIQPLLDYLENSGHGGELDQTYRRLAQFLQIGGDSENALLCLEKAEASRSIRSEHQMRQAQQASQMYINEIMQTRAINKQISERRVTLERTLVMYRIVLFGLPLVALCLFFWQRSQRFMTQQKILQERVAEQTASLQQAKDEAEAANQAKTEFVARINHELRNPLATILGSIELLADATTDDLPKIKHTIHSCSLNLMDTVDDVLDFANIESGKLEVREDEFSVRELIHIVQDIVSPNISQNTSLQIQLATDIPDRIYADESKLRQILVNLGQNAARHTENGTITLRCHSVVTNSGSDYNDQVLLRFEVEDTGSGIPESQLANIFTEFNSTRRRSGSGLGLYIASAFAAAMRGNLTCESELGRGSLFTLFVPAFASTHRPSLETGPTLPADFSAKILIVDDQEEVARLIQKILVKLGHDACYAHSWQDAVPHLEAGVDMVLLDIRMPEISGFEFFDKLCQLQAGKRPVVCAVTGDATTCTRMEVEEAGFDGFLAKPFTISAMQSLIQTLLDRTR